MEKIKYSVIIISYNEEDNIIDCIKSVECGRKDVEIIIVDGGSKDLTVELIKNSGHKIIHSRLGRGIQLNMGAKEAVGDILLFLHSDTKLPANAFEILDEIFSKQEILAGTFQLSFDYNHPLLRLYSMFTKIDSLFTNFGDQAITIRKNLFEKINGYPDWKMFEDVQLLRNIRRISKIHRFPAAVTTSSRSFIQHGIFKQQIKSAWLLTLFLLGFSPDRLYDKYYPEFCAKPFKPKINMGEQG